MSKPIAQNDLVQVNEEGPPSWFRCILVVHEVTSWGVTGFCTVPNPHGESSGDAFKRLEWHEFDVLDAKSKFVAWGEPVAPAS